MKALLEAMEIWTYPAEVPQRWSGRLSRVVGFLYSGFWVDEYRGFLAVLGYRGSALDEWWFEFLPAVLPTPGTESVYC